MAIMKPGDIVYMTIEEIDREYDGQWVYIINLQTDDTNTVVGGEVAAHDSSRGKVIRMMFDMDNESIYIKYAGKIPERVSVLL